MSLGLISEPCHSALDFLCAFDRRYNGGPVHKEDGGDSFRARVAWIRPGMTKEQIKAYVSQTKFGHTDDFGISNYFGSRSTKVVRRTFLSEAARDVLTLAMRADST